jgi:hypothetical protein
LVHYYLGRYTNELVNIGTWEALHLL